MPSLSQLRSKPPRWWLRTPLYAARKIYFWGWPWLSFQIGTRPLLWKLAGRPLPAPPVMRRAILRDYALRYGLKTFVETGTWHGDTVAAIMPHVERVFSIELSENLFRAAQKRFASTPQVTLLQGDSTDCLPMVLSRIESPALFWLDGHFSAGVTARGALETPIDAEMRLILEAARHDENLAQSVLLIDDARDFGRGDYPTIDSLRERVEDQFPGALFAVELDIIRIVLVPSAQRPPSKAATSV